VHVELGKPDDAGASGDMLQPPAATLRRGSPSTRPSGCNSSNSVIAHRFGGVVEKVNHTAPRRPVRFSRRPIPTPELTREQLIATAVKAGFTLAQAEQALALDRI
jgi:hypothetical protein